MARQRGSGWARAGDVALSVLAVLGALCIVLAVAAVFFDVRIIMFRTGSMSPTIPAGAAALVHGIPAADVQVGDVITVDRIGDLPVTHRVVGVEPSPTDDDARLITMRGDANPVDDPYPYDVKKVRKVLFSVPGIAPALASLGNPWVLGTVTVAASALIVFVFWPRRRRHDDDPPADDPPAGDPPTDASPDAAASGERPLTRAAARAMTGTTTVLCLTIAAIVVGSPAPAHAAAGETIIQGAVIRLVSVTSPEMQQLTPGSSAVWQVGVSANAETPGTLTVTLAGTAAAGTPLRYDVQGCPQRWTSSTCAGSEVLVADSPAPTDGAPFVLQTVASTAQLWLRIQVSVPTDADPVVSPLQLTVRVTGVGDDVSTGTDGGGLAVTGGAAAGWTLAAVAVVLTAIGAGMLLRARRRT